MPHYLGQHFLKNAAVIPKIIAALDVQHGETVIEIGPGHGALTLPLVKRCAETGCRIVAIEKDAQLTQELAGLRIDKLEVVEGDALKELPRFISRYTLTANRYTLVGNIPYYITGKLLRVIGELEPKPKRTVLMIQKEVAERLTAKPGAMNLLAAAVQVWADVSIVARLKPVDFDPPPKVESAVVMLASRDWPLATSERVRYYKLIHAAFKQPRKTLLNNLSDAFGKPKSELAEALRRYGYTEKTRAQELGVAELLALTRDIR